MDNFEDVVLTTRIRLARNINGFNFTNNMTDKRKQELIDYVKDKTKGKYDVLELNNMDDVTKKSLVETHIISKELLLNNNTALIIDKDKNVNIMLNEEDHLRIQSFTPSFDIDKAYSNIISIDEDLSKVLDYSYSKEYGYITACPTCIGTGLRVSLMLHLPALEKTGLIEKVFNEITNLGISIRGIYGENTQGEGSIFQISNQKTLGITETEIIERVKQVTNYVVKQERKARELLKERIEIKDEIHRAYGILTNALIMYKKEAIQLLSNVRMGINMGIITNVELSKIDNLIENIGINTLRKNLKEHFPKEQENLKRAEYIKSII